MREAVVVASSRTPLAKSHRGSFNMTRPDDLAAHAIRDVLGKAPQLQPNEIEEVILGCGQPHGSQGHNIARVAALRAGLPVTTPGATVNRFCNSGLQAVVQAAHMVLQEGVETVIGGGIESITMLQRDNSPNPWVKEHYPGLYMVMGDTAEVVAKRYKISRQAQDEYSLQSQQRTARAQQEGFFKEEIAPMQVKRAVLDKKTGEKIGEEDHYVDGDECNRGDTTLEGLAKLAPVFDTKSGQGSVTAGNSSQLSDGASATLVMSMERAKALGIRPKLVFRGYAVAACEPDEMGIGPVFAVPKLLAKHGLRVQDIDVWELNEAFASQVVYCRDRLGLPMDRLNINGGSISIGHPFGMTGSRLVGTIANELLRRRGRYGVVTMCVGGGQGAAALFEACL
ncbi:MAG: acetyl-CoA acetyltransferase [Candidatus Rokubacteria bacterium 13_1_40CM_68_15]|nr:MAG: acetyl-CoA acetyltransferase [Candidatus Rokubacteria bacterium 13_1_40CM_68_15]